MSESWAKLPKWIRIIGKRYRAEVVDKVDAEDSDGESDPVNQKLLLARGLGFENARDTALHEVIHGVDHQMRLALTEEQVEGLGTGVLAVMRDNPSFVRWLMAREKD